MPATDALFIALCGTVRVQEALLQGGIALLCLLSQGLVMWVVVKIMVLFWVPNVIRHLLFLKYPPKYCSGWYESSQAATGAVVAVSLGSRVFASRQKPTAAKPSPVANYTQ